MKLPGYTERAVAVPPGLHFIEACGVQPPTMSVATGRSSFGRCTSLRPQFLQSHVSLSKVAVPLGTALH